MNDIREALKRLSKLPDAWNWCIENSKLGIVVTVNTLGDGWLYYQEIVQTVDEIPTAINLVLERVERRDPSDPIPARPRPKERTKR